MACCELPHDPRMTCEEMAWCVDAPNEAEAFRRTMAVCARIEGRPIDEGRQAVGRRRFRANIARMAETRSRQN